MTLEYDTEVSSGTRIGIPLGHGVNVDVDWGDGNIEESVTSIGLLQHTYASEGKYSVSVTGSLLQFGSSVLNPDADKLIKVTSFGDLGITSLSYAFFQAVNLSEVPTQIPAGVTSLRGTFQEATAFNGDISNWDVSQVSDMENLFNSASAFKGDLSSWDVSSVTNMRAMFVSAYVFNSDISSWDVSSVTDMAFMFHEANLFNGDISNWDVSSVITMERMFLMDTSFNADLSSWDVSNVTSMTGMFGDCSSSNSLCSWVFGMVVVGIL